MDDLTGVHVFDHTDDSEGWNTPEDSMLHMALDIEGICEQRGWEGENEFHNTMLGAVFIGLEDLDEDMAELRSQVCWVSPLPVPDFVMSDLAAYLPIIAQTAPAGVQHWQSHWQEDCVPIATVTTFEGWTIDTPAGEMTPEQELARMTRSLHTLPERIEERHCLVHLFNDKLVLVTRRRGEEPKAQTIDPNDGSGVELKGRLPIALRELTRVLVGPLWSGGDEDE